MKKKTIVFDFDGVIHSYISGWKGVDVIPDPPVYGMREALHQLCIKGYEIVIVSTRASSPEGTAAMVDWLDKYDFNQCYDRITAEKAPAICYIDDRAIRFDGNVKKMMSDIESLIPWMDKIPRNAGAVVFQDDVMRKMSPKNIVILGSCSQRETFDKIEQKYKMKGHNVWRPINQPDRPFKEIVQECFEAIKKADEVIAIPKPDDSFGMGTTYEICFAEFFGKDVQISCFPEFFGKDFQNNQSKEQEIVRKKWEEDL